MSKMRTFTLESTHFIFIKCPIHSHDGASAKFSTNSNEMDYSVGPYICMEDSNRSQTDQVRTATGHRERSGKCSTNDRQIRSKATGDQRSKVTGDRQIRRRQQQSIDRSGQQQVTGRAKEDNNK